MARTTGTDVLAIMDNCDVSASDIETYYIPAANALITKVYENDTEMTSSELASIETWYTAHLIARSRFRTTANEKLGNAAVTYTGKYGMNLDSTPYGQVVKELDRSGLMSRIGKKVARLKAIKQ